MQILRFEDDIILPADEKKEFEEVLERMLSYAGSLSED